MIKKVVRYRSEAACKDFDTELEARQADVAANLKNAFCKAMGLDLFKGNGGFSVPQLLNQLIANEDAVREVFRNAKLNKNVVFKSYPLNVMQSGKFFATPS